MRAGDNGTIPDGRGGARRAGAAAFGHDASADAGVDGVASRSGADRALGLVGGVRLGKSTMSGAIVGDRRTHSPDRCSRGDSDGLRGATRRAAVSRIQLVPQAPYACSTRA